MGPRRGGVLLAILAAAVCGEIWFVFGQAHGARYLVQRAEGLFDRRPPRSVLLIGNSRTYYHDLPAMLRAIADSAGSQTKLQVEMDATSGGSFQSHWSEARTQALLRDRWDEIVFQGESAGQLGEANKASFLGYGEKLLRAAHPASGAPQLVVNWAYGPEFYQAYGGDEAREEHRHAISRVHRLLAERTGARLLSVDRAWEIARRTHPSIALTEDGNHPTVAGSYLYALAVYAGLSKQSVSPIGYAPEGLSAADAAALRQAVDDAGLGS